MPVLELFLAVRDDIPLHHAARTAGADDRSLLEVRFQAFANELLGLNVSVVPAVGRGNRLKMAAVVTPVTKPCGHCGERYFGTARSRFCCRRCHGLAQHAWRRAA